MDLIESDFDRACRVAALFPESVKAEMLKNAGSDSEYIAAILSTEYVWRSHYRVFREGKEEGAK